MRKWLKDARIEKGYSHGDVAEKAKISRSYYTHIENDTKTPTVDVAKRIGSVLGFHWTVFFEGHSSQKEQKTSKLENATA